MGRRYLSKRWWAGVAAGIAAAAAAVAELLR